MVAFEFFFGGMTGIISVVRLKVLFEMRQHSIMMKRSLPLFKWSVIELHWYDSALYGANGWGLKFQEANIAIVR